MGQETVSEAASSSKKSPDDVQSSASSQVPNKPETPERQFKSNWEVTETVIQFFKNSEEKRSVERVLLVPDSTKNRWLAFHPNNPDLKFKPSGSYVFVTHCRKDVNPEHPEGKKIAAWPVAKKYTHSGKFHLGLSAFAPQVAYAGEVHFSTSGRLRYFDNSSGTYNPDEAHKAQSGFDPEKFKKPNFSF